mgnify:CR=1 FL=1
MKVKNVYALGTLLPILGGGATAEAPVPAGWRANPDSSSRVIWV